jgi:hypothetical protein
MRLGRKIASPGAMTNYKTSYWLPILCALELPFYLAECSYVALTRHLMSSHLPRPAPAKVTPSLDW